MKALLRIGLLCLFFLQVNLISFAQSGMITTSAVISTVAGNGVQGFSGDGNLATSAQLHNPSGVTVDTAGNLFIADFANNRIRKVTPAGVISTVAGNGIQGFSGDGGLATSAQLFAPSSVAVDTTGNLFVADTGNNRIRKVTPAGIISTAAGNGILGFAGDGDPATLAQLYAPSGVAVDTAGNLYIADAGNNCIRKVTPAGIISTVAGTAPPFMPANETPGFGGDGGQATLAQLYAPYSVAVDTAGNLYIADTNNLRIRKVTPAGIISTVAGNGTQGFSGDGDQATLAELYAPYGVAVDTAGNLYIADAGNDRIREVTPAGIISTVAGNGTPGFSGDGGPATSAQLYAPYGVAADTTGDLFIADLDNARIREVSGVSVSAYFPQVAVGGGYSTLFTIINTGAIIASGTVTLTDQQGNPLTVSGLVVDAYGTTPSVVSASSFAFSVPSGGTFFLTAFAPTTNSPLEIGWAQINSTGGTLSAVATYEYAVGSATQSLIGVLQSQAVQYMTIPVDDNSSQNMQTAYAIANPSNQTIAIKLVLVGQNGTVVDDSVTLTLTPGQQISRYLRQDIAAAATFKGTLVLSGQNGATFAAVALVDKQGIFSVIPIISGKAPGIPD